MNLTDSDIKDLVSGTLENYDPMKFQQIAQPLQRYEVMKKWLKGDQVIIDGGYGINRAVMVALGSGMKWTGLHGQDTLNIATHMKNIQIPWRHATHNWSFDRREVSMNSGDPKALIYKIVDPRRIGAMIQIAQGLEESAWTLAAVDDEMTPWGVPNWIVKNASEGFNGGAPAGYTTVAGLNPTTYPKWKNYSGTYANVSKADLVKKMRKAHNLLNWQSPVDIKDFRKGSGMDLRFYMGIDELLELETLGEQQNDNLGQDLASMDGMITFRRHPTVYIPYLDADTDNPIYGIDHSTFHPVILKGEFLRESEPEKMTGAGMHNTWSVFVDLTINFMCIDRQRNMVLYQA
jgi:hypothetical protein